MTGAHDGYRRLRSPVTHRRTVVHTHGLWLVLDFLEGTGRHSLRSFLHLDPSVAAAEGPGSALLTAAGSSLRVVPFGPLPLRIVEARMEPIESWHADHLGERCPGRALVLEGSLDLPVAFGWLLVPGGVEASLVVSPAERGFLARVDLPSGPVRIERDGPVLSAEAAR
jgi:hypothetical protein